MRFTFAVVASCALRLMQVAATTTTTIDCVSCGQCLTKRWCSDGQPQSCHHLGRCCSCDKRRHWKPAPATTTTKAPAILTTTTMNTAMTTGTFSITTTYPPSGWYLGGNTQSCDSACSSLGLVCSAHQLEAHDDEVDSQNEVAALMRKVGGVTCSAFGTGGCTPCGADKRVPFYVPSSGHCAYSEPGVRSLWGCDINSRSIHSTSIRRLCYCHRPAPLPTTTPTAPPAYFFQTDGACATPLKEIECRAVAKHINAPGHTTHPTTCTQPCAPVGCYHGTDRKVYYNNDILGRDCTTQLTCLCKGTRPPAKAPPAYFLQTDGACATPLTKIECRAVAEHINAPGHTIYPTPCTQPCSPVGCYQGTDRKVYYNNDILGRDCTILVTCFCKGTRPPAKTTTTRTTTVIKTNRTWYYQRLQSTCRSPTLSGGSCRVNSVNECEMKCDATKGCGGFNFFDITHWRIAVGYAVLIKNCHLTPNCEGPHGKGDGYKKVQTACDDSLNACRIKAAALGILFGGRTYSKPNEQGCFGYTSGKNAGIAFYGYVAPVAQPSIYVGDKYHLSTCQAFIYGERGREECPAGSTYVQSKAECESASQHLAVVYDGENSAHFNRLPYCWSWKVSVRHVNFNPNGDSGHNAPFGKKNKLVCKQAACDYSLNACRIKAAALGLELGSRGYSMDRAYSQFSETGCFAYSAGKYAGVAFYGYVRSGGEVQRPSQLTKISRADRYRVSTCQDTFPDLMADPPNDGKECGTSHGQDTIFDLRGSAATAHNCKGSCAAHAACVAFSGVFGSWCIGCKSPLSAAHPTAVAYKKQALTTITTTTTQPEVFVEGSLRLKVSNATRFVTEPTAPAILGTAIAELFNVSVDWIRNVVVVLAKRGSPSRLRRRKLQAPAASSRKRPDSVVFTGQTQVGVTWKLVVPPGNRTHAVVTVLVNKFGRRTLREVTKAVNSLIRYGLVGYNVQVLYKVARAKVTASHQPPDDSSNSKDEGRPWQVYVLIIVCPCAIAACVSIAGTRYFCPKLLPQWITLQKKSQDPIPERKPANSSGEFARRAGQFAAWSVEELMKPPDVISSQHGQQLRQLVRAIYQERVYDATVYITFASGHREKDAPGYGPGSFFAAAIIKTLHNAGLPCFSELLFPSDSEARLLFASKLAFREGKCNVLLVVQTDDLYTCKYCLGELYSAHKFRLQMLPLRFDETMPAEQSPWPHITTKDMDGMIMVCDVQKYFCSLNSIPSPPYTVLTQPSVLEHVIEDLKTRYGQSATIVPERKTTFIPLKNNSPQDDKAALTTWSAPVKDDSCLVQKYGNSFHEDSANPEVCNHLFSASQAPSTAQQDVVQNVKSSSSVVPPYRERSAPSYRERSANSKKLKGARTMKNVGRALPPPMKIPSNGSEEPTILEWRPIPSDSNSSSTRQLAPKTTFPMQKSPSRKGKRGNSDAPERQQSTDSVSRGLSARKANNRSGLPAASKSLRGHTPSLRPNGGGSKRLKHPCETNHDDQHQSSRRDPSELSCNQGKTASAELQADCVAGRPPPARKKQAPTQMLSVDVQPSVDFQPAATAPTRHGNRTEVAVIKASKTECSAAPATKRKKTTADKAASLAKVRSTKQATHDRAAVH